MFAPYWRENNACSTILQPHEVSCCQARIMRSTPKSRICNQVKLRLCSSVSSKPLRRTTSTVAARMPPPKLEARKGESIEVFKNEMSTSFLKPLIPSFVVGTSVGALCEVVHTVLRMWDFFTEKAFLRLGEAYPRFIETFTPWFFGDHVAAVSVFALLYSVQVFAVIAMFQQSSTENLSEAAEPWFTLPRRLLPWKFTSVKALVSKMIGAQKPEIEDFPVIDAVPVSTPQELLSPSSFPFQIPPVNIADLALEHDWLKRKNELVERESYLTNFWYAAALSEKVSDQPLGVEILGMKVVLFRDDSGRVHCLKDVCPHRSAPLSEGWMATKNNKKCIVCPYHGWAFDGEGTIQHIPTTDNLPVCSRVDSFVVEELGGFVWLFYDHPLGPKLPAEERPPIPYIPEFDDPNWRASYSELEFNCGHWSVFENAMDLAHIHYLHGDSFGNAAKPRIENLKATKDAFGINATCNIYNKPVNFLWKFTEIDTVSVKAQIKLPSTSVIKIELGAGIQFITFVNTVPIDKNRSINRFALLRNFLPWPSKVWDLWARSAMLKILSQDKAMVEQLRPELLMYDVSVDIDIVQTLFRKLRHDYFKMGYGFHPLYD